MSAFLVDQKSIERISKTLCEVVNGELPTLIRDRFPAYWVKQYAKDYMKNGKLNYKEMCFRLYGLNVMALIGRYGDNAEDYFPEKLGYHFKSNPGIGASQLYSDTRYSLYKSVGCYLYQCSEDGADTDPLYYLVQQLENAIAKFIVESDSRYEQADWN